MGRCCYQCRNTTTNSEWNGVALLFFLFCSWKFVFYSISVLFSYMVVYCSRNRNGLVVVLSFSFRLCQLSYLTDACDKASGVSTAGKLSVVKSTGFVATTAGSLPSCSVRQRFCAGTDDDDDTESLCILVQANVSPSAVANLHLSPNASAVSPPLVW